jgi:N-acetylglucosamine malate deacetylase 1
MGSQRVLAIAAHPDDIEFVMAGTLLQLAARGWEVHYFNIANGCGGSMTLDRAACAATRLQEAQLAAAMLPAKFYPPICDDLEIFYSKELLQQVAAVVRQAQPEIVLTHAPLDYMEDHQNASRLAVTAAFVRGMPNYVTNPPTQPYATDVSVYHAQPHGNRTPLGELVTPTHVVDVSAYAQRKQELLCAHASQGQWLDDTQRMSSYVDTMFELNREVGTMSGKFKLAEGWRKHLHLGFSASGIDPLADALGSDLMLMNAPPFSNHPEAGRRA